jgi:hypothetical protein
MPRNKSGNQSYHIISKKKKSKTHTHLGINLNKEMKYLNYENYKTLKKGIEQDTRRWKDLPHSWIRRINIVKMNIFQKGPKII